jgi:hypothetical protein
MNDERTAPKFEDAPGLVMRPRRIGWAAIWQPRSDLIAKGCPLKQQHIAYIIDEPTDEQRAEISDRCNSLQANMLAWSYGAATSDRFDGSLRMLIYCYQTDRDSTYHTGRYKTRLFYDHLCSRIDRDYGDVMLADIKGRQFRRWHEEWTKRGITMAHSLMGMLRTLFGFGATLLEDEECERLSGVLHQMKFKMAKARNEHLTAEQVEAIIAEANRRGFQSIALAQAIQFECLFRQKDLIGEWVPLSERDLSDIEYNGWKWLRGIKWQEIDDDHILRHTTSKRLKDIEVDLKLAPMTIAQLTKMGGLLSKGPVIVCETTGRPWKAGNFQSQWRKIATAVGVPKTVRNMDSRAGGISEATDAGAELEHVRHAATHSDIGMTQRYSRNARDKTDNVMQLRAAHRNKTGA